MRTLSSIFLTLLCISAFSQEKAVFTHLAAIEQQAIPDDSSDYTMRKGVLDNGLTYYVRRHDNPAKQAYFYLLVKAGSMVEQDNERGIAHFVEHMVFKGTRHFPKGDVMNFFRRNGLHFGHDSNAFTGFTTVRYLLNAIPTENTLLMDSCLLVLRDWAGDATIDAKDVESEHSVVVEEWRTKSTISFAQQLIDDVFANSIYAKRNPIGDMDIVKNCSQKMVRDFYNRWYQPQNQAVVVVGDFDPDKMVEKIRLTFGDLKRGKTVSPVPPAIPDFETPKVLLYPNNKQAFGALAYMMRLGEDTAMPRNTVGGLKTAVLREEIKTVMGKKLSSLAAKFPTLLGGEVQATDLSDVNDKLWVFNLSAPQDQWRRTLELLAKQVELIRRKGFGADYWKQEQRAISPEYNADSTGIVFVDTFFVKNDRTQSTEFANKCIDNFFKGNAMLSKMARQLAERHLRNTITADEMREEFCRMTSGRNMMIGVMLTDSAALPRKEEVEALYRRVSQMSDEELAEVEVAELKKLDRTTVDSLEIPTVPGTIVKQEVLNDSITEVMLSNGIKVVLMKQKTGHNSVNFRFCRPQGYSALSDDDIHYHDMLGSCLRKFSFWGGESNAVVEAFDDIFDFGTGSLDKLEGGMKMLYMSLTTNEVDSVAFAEELQKLQASAVTMKGPVLQSALRVGLAYAQETKRLMPPTEQQVAAMSIDRFRQIVNDYHSNYNGSVMVVQGDRDLDSIMPHILKYVGALPSKPERAKRMVWPADHYATQNTTMVEKVENPAPICQASLIYAWERGFKYTQESYAHNLVLQSVLGNLILNKLRLQNGDIYSSTCQKEDGLLPVPHMKLTVSFACNPTQRERIVQDVQDLVKGMAEGDLITQQLIDSYLKEREKHAAAFKGNEFTRRRDYLTQELNGIVVNEGDMTYIRQVTPASLRAHVKKLLKQGTLHVGYLTTE